LVVSRAFLVERVDFWAKNMETADQWTINTFRHIFSYLPSFTAFSIKPNDCNNKLFVLKLEDLSLSQAERLPTFPNYPSG